MPRQDGGRRNFSKRRIERQPLFCEEDALRPNIEVVLSEHEIALLGEGYGVGTSPLLPDLVVRAIPALPCELKTSRRWAMVFAFENPMERWGWQLGGGWTVVGRNTLWSVINIYHFGWLEAIPSKVPDYSDDHPLIRGIRRPFGSVRVVLVAEREAARHCR